jgi:hypothetical protein
MNKGRRVLVIGRRIAFIQALLYFTYQAHK